MSVELHPSARSGPLQYSVSRTIRLTSTPLARTCAARSDISGAPLYTVSTPSPRADRVTSPPPTRMMSPSWSPLTTLVTNRLVGSTEVSSAVPVSSLAVDAGSCGALASWFQSTVPLCGSMMTPLNWARLGLPNWAASCASIPAVVGTLSEMARGMIFGAGAVTGGSTTWAAVVVVDEVLPDPRLPR